MSEKIIQAGSVIDRNWKRLGVVTILDCGCHVIREVEIGVADYHQRYVKILVCEKCTSTMTPSELFGDNPVLP